MLLEQVIFNNISSAYLGLRGAGPQRGPGCRLARGLGDDAGRGGGGAVGVQHPGGADGRERWNGEACPS